MQYPLELFREEVVDIIRKYFHDRGYRSIEIRLETPPEEFGDLALPCFQFAPLLKKKPEDIADLIKKDLEEKIKDAKWVEKVEKKGAYLNFFIREDLLVRETINTILKMREEYGKLEKKNRKVIIEHTSANPNGPLHVGRARNPIIGDSLVRLYKTCGYDVESQFYVDNIGKQVAILAWGVNNIDAKKVPQPRYDKADHKLVGFYQLAYKQMEENPNVKKEIDEIVKKCEHGDKKTISMMKNIANKALEGIKESLRQINITIDRYVPESNFIEDGSCEKVISQLRKTKYAGTEDNAIYLDLKDFGIKGRDTRFFITRKDGTSLYATRDIAYHIWKSKQADMLINVLGEDHKLEARQVEIALKLLNIKNIPKVVFYAFVSLPQGRMSTRRGRVVYLDDLINEGIARAYEEVKKRREGELTREKMEKIARKVGVGAIRYNIVKIQPEKEIVFKWEDALDFEGDSAPFIQYAHARASSILKKAGKTEKIFDPSLIKHPSEIRLVKILAMLPSKLKTACETCRPNIIANFAYEIAVRFNEFYRDCRVIGSEKKLEKARLLIVKATKIVLKNVLDLIGIEAPEEM